MGILHISIKVVYTFFGVCGAYVQKNLHQPVGFVPPYVGNPTTTQSKKGEKNEKQQGYKNEKQQGSMGNVCNLDDNIIFRVWLLYFQDQ